jgi:hypothetical protein
VSGVAVIAYLLRNTTAVTDVVAAARIKAGNVKQGTTLPAISITQISSTPSRVINVNDSKFHTDRVQVTVHRKATPDDDGYPGLKTLLNLVKSACANQRATINGVKVDSISPDIEGPDIEDPSTGIYTRSRDFIVRWTE